MDHARWKEVKSIFHRALAEPEGGRETFVQKACGGDDALAQSVLGLLDNDRTDAIPGLPGADLPPIPSVQAGERFGPYRLVRELGAGGMGRVFLALRDDGVFEKEVALKFVRHDVGSKIALDRFVAERRMLARLQHPNIAALLDGGVSEGGIPYLVMEYVPGESIGHFCDERRLTIRGRVELFLDVCAAVQHAHRQLIIHRDLKPGNILVTDEGEVKLLDFGIAKLVEDQGEDSVALTRTGARLMTPEYASPEQVAGTEVTTASDVYALGVVLYELVTGKRPFSFGVGSLAEIARIVLETPPPRPSTALTRWEDDADPTDLGRLRSTDPHRLSREVQGDLDTIIMMALHKEPDRRYPTVAALRDDLERYLQGLPVRARPDSWAYRARKFAGRHRLGVASAAAALVALVSFATFYTQRITTERDRARAEQQKAEQVVGFLQGILGSPRPELDGRDVTVVEVVEDMATSIGSEFEDQPQVEAVLRATIGYTFQGLGYYDRSQEEIQEARRLLEADHETPPARLAQAIGDVARLQHDRGVYDSARMNYERAIDMYRSEAPEDTGLEDTLNDLGTLLSQQGDLAASNEVFDEALQRTRARYGESDPEVAQVLISMGSNSLTLGRRDLAEEQLVEAIRIFTGNPGNEFPLSFAVNNLAYARLEAEDLPAADSLFRWSLALRRQIHGDRHPQVALGLHSLASQVLFAKGEYAEAESMLLEALDIYREAFPEGHLYPSVSLTSLGKVRLAQDRLPEAEAALWQSLAMQERLLPDDHGVLAHTRGLLGEALRRQGRLEEAEPLLLRSLAGFEAGERADMAAEREDTRRSLVALYEALGKPEEADRYR